MITQERLKELFKYDPESGSFTRVNGVRKVGWIEDTGYTRMSIDNVKYYLHRLAFLYMTGEFPEVVDHINHNKLDNKFSNLCNGTYTSNSKNMPMSKANNSTVVGVSWDKTRGKWKVQAHVDGKNKMLGRFNAKEDAIACRKSANQQHNYHENHGR